LGLYEVPTGAEPENRKRWIVESSLLLKLEEAFEASNGAASEVFKRKNVEEFPLRLSGLCAFQSDQD